MAIYKESDDHVPDPSLPVGQLETALPGTGNHTLRHIVPGLFTPPPEGSAILYAGEGVPAQPLDSTGELLLGHERFGTETQPGEVHASDPGSGTARYTSDPAPTEAVDAPETIEGDSTVTEAGDAGFDLSTATVAATRVHLGEVDAAEVQRVIARERAGQNRKGIVEYERPSP